MRCRAREWASRFPIKAKQILTPPKTHAVVAAAAPHLTTKTAANGVCTSLEEYLQKRNWPLIADLKEDDDDYEMCAAAIDLVSHPLTYPLTLSIFASFLLSSNTHRNKQNEETECGNSSKNDTTTTMRIFCIGARAEATLPSPFWKEFLIATRQQNLYRMKEDGNQYQHNNACTVRNNWDIQFIGPEVVVPRASTIHISIPDCDDDVDDEDSSLKLSLSFHKGYYKEAHIHDYDTTSNDVAFVLFNPGLGHPHLKSGWRDAMDSIVQTRLPLFLTAHSELDQDRDWNMLRESFERVGRPMPLHVVHVHGDDGYRLCPFASRMSTPDPLDGGRAVRANAYYLYVPPA